MCQAGSDCAIECAGPACDVECSTATSCVVNCNDDCDVTCPATGCTVTNCPDSDLCNVDCGVGGEPTRNGDTATCP